MKIESGAVIKKCEIKPECAELKFDGFDFTSNQYKKIAEWIKNNTELIIIMQPAQEEIPFKSEKD